MEGISDIRIVGMDPKRPAVIQKAPYIDLFFELSHEVPVDWAKDFNEMLSKHKHPAKVQLESRSFIETWVRTPDDVAHHHSLLKAKVVECNDRCKERIERAAAQRDAGREAPGAQGGEQGRLNEIIAGLDFSA